MICPECGETDLIDNVMTLWEDEYIRCDLCICANCGHEWEIIVEDEESDD